MKKKNQNSMLVEQLGVVQQLLSSDTLDQTILYEVAAELSQFGESAREASRTSLHRGALLLSQISELSAGSSPDEQDEFIEFTIHHVLTLDDAIASKEAEKNVDLFVKDANERWGDYLSLMSDKESESGWSTNEQQGSNHTEAESDSGDQIKMMLAALSAAPNEAHEPETPKQQDTTKTKPAKKNKKKQPQSKAPQESKSKPVDRKTKSNEPFSDVESAKPNTIAPPPLDADAKAREMLANDQFLLEAYLDDALRCLGSMEQVALAVEQTPDDHEQVRQFCRELHTLKGASATVGLADLASYIHELESSLESIFESEDELCADPLFSAVDYVREIVDSLQSPADSKHDSETAEKPAAKEVSASFDPIKKPQRATPKSKPEFSNFNTNDDASIRIRASKLDRLMDMLAELVVLRNRRESHVSEFNELNAELSRCAARVGVADEQWEQLAHLDEQAIDEFSSARPETNLAEVAKDITAVSRGLRDLQKPVLQDNSSISCFIRDFRQELMQLRRVPVSGLFGRLQRAARDAAKSEDKKVQVKLIGENSGLEQEIQERLYESLLHVVRNSVSHGIENEAQRKKAGKEPVGTVTLEATSNAQLLIIEVRDDGNGINYAAVKKRAEEKGLISPADMLSKNELARLIFHPGFSTRETASEVSGRGVGMDIVATTVEQLRGRIEIDSVPGQGTTIRLLIPLRTGIEHVMVFRSANQLFALPMQSVTAAKASNKELTKISLASALGLRTGASKDNASEDVLILKHNDNSFNPRDPLANSRFAIGVDELVGPEEVVVRGLPNLLKNHPLFCGITLSGTGEKVLLLDSERIVSFCNLHQKDLFNDPNEDESSTAAAGNQRTALVVDDSLTARKVLAKLLRQHDFQIVEAGDGIEAIEKLHRGSFDLVVTDLDMPRMGGLELLTDIQSGQYCDAPSAVVSSRREQKFRDKALEVGANEYLTKPVSESSIKQMLESLELMPESVGG